MKPETELPGFAQAKQRQPVIFRAQQAQSLCFSPSQCGAVMLMYWFAIFARHFR
jgi:hypothetical protein